MDTSDRAGDRQNIVALLRVHRKQVDSTIGVVQPENGGHGQIILRRG
jgi:hypothetical protein